MCSPACPKLWVSVALVSSTAWPRLKPTSKPEEPDCRIPNIPFPSLLFTSPLGTFVSSVNGLEAGVKRARKVKVTPSLSKLFAFVTVDSCAML